MRADWAVMRARFLGLLQYRAAAAAGAATQLCFGWIRIQIFAGFYASSTATQPIDLGDVVAYVWLGQAFFAMLPWRLDPQLHDMFVKGEVAYELLRPVDLYRYWYARVMAFLAAPALLRCAPIFLVAGATGQLGLPPDLPAAAAALAALAGSLVLGAALVTTLCVSHFWTLSGQGVTTVHGAAFWLFSGMLLPLPLMPEWMARLAWLLPYRGCVDAPYRLYLGHLPPSALAGVLAHQLAWALALVLLGRGLLRLGHRRLVVQGG